jgi:hypothetical protein
MTNRTLRRSPLCVLHKACQKLVAGWRCLTWAGLAIVAWGRTEQMPRSKGLMHVSNALVTVSHLGASVVYRRLD